MRRKKWFQRGKLLRLPKPELKSSLIDPSNIIQRAPMPLKIKATQLRTGEDFLRNSRSKSAAKSGSSVKIAAVDTVVVYLKATNIKTKYME